LMEALIDGKSSCNRMIGLVILASD
jgi:hypothetical protein